MRKIKFITDSACDIPKAQALELDITVLPIPLTIKDKGYLEGVDFTNEEFYNILLTSDDIPVTSHITAIQFEDEYKKAFNEGYDDIIHITINSLGSNMFDAANLAKRNFFDENPNVADKNIYIIDSHTYSYTYGYPICESAKMAKNGSSAQEIVNYLEEYFAKVEIYFSVYSLDHVKKSGRVSCAAAFVGELLGLKPIITIIDGVAKINEKVRGDKAVVPKLVKEVCENITPNTPYYVIKGCLDEPAIELAAELTKALGYPPVGIFNAGAAISLNSGPKLVAAIIEGKKRR